MPAHDDLAAVTPITSATSTTTPSADGVEASLERLLLEGRRVAGAVVPAGPDIESIETEARRRRAGRRLASGAVSVIVLVAGVIGAGFLDDRQPTRVTTASPGPTDEAEDAEVDRSDEAEIADVTIPDETSSTEVDVRSDDTSVTGSDSTRPENPEPDNTETDKTRPDDTGRDNPDPPRQTSLAPTIDGPPGVPTPSTRPSTTGTAGPNPGSGGSGTPTVSSPGPTTTSTDDGRTITTEDAPITTAPAQPVDPGDDGTQNPSSGCPTPDPLFLNRGGGGSYGRYDDSGNGFQVTLTIGRDAPDLIAAAAAARDRFDVIGDYTIFTSFGGETTVSTAHSPTVLVSATGAADRQTMIAVITDPRSSGIPFAPVTDGPPCPPPGSGQG